MNPALVHGALGVRAPTVLGRRLVVAILLINLVLSLVATATQLSIAYRRDADDVLNLVHVIESSFGKGFEDALWEYNFELVDALLDGVYNKGDVYHVALDVPSGRRWIRGASAPGEQITRQLSFWHTGSGEERRSVGTLTIGLTLDNVKARAWAQFWVLLGSNFAKSALASIAMLLLLGHVVTRHLRTIADHVSNRSWLQHGDQLTLERHAPDEEDEIDLIVNAINVSRSRAAIDYQRITCEVERRGAAERLSAERAFELSQANRSLAEASQEQAEFTWALAHDLKAPINSVALLLAEHDSEALPGGEDAADLLSLARLTNERMSVLVDDVLAYSRTLGAPAEPERIELTTLVPQVLEDLRADIVSANATVQVEPLPAVAGNPWQIRILLQNLVSNAIKFRSDKRAALVTVRSAPAGLQEFVQILVIDNGIGIDDQHHATIFGLFERLHGHDAYRGSGVGLALCKRVVEMQGGSITVDSSLDNGTTITLTLRKAA